MLDFYEAKRAALAVRPNGIDHVGAGTIVEILLAVGVPAPLPLTGEDDKPLRVWICDAWWSMTTEMRQSHRVHRGMGHQVSGYITGKSKADVARQVVPSHVRSKRTQGISEVPVTDYRYVLAASNPGCLIVPRGGEFDDDVDVITPEQIQERL